MEEKKLVKEKEAAKVTGGVEGNSAEKCPKCGKNTLIPYPNLAMSECAYCGYRKNW